MREKIPLFSPSQRREYTGEASVDDVEVWDSATGEMFLGYKRSWFSLCWPQFPQSIQCMLNTVK